MENPTKGTKYGVRNNNGHSWYCGDGYQYHCYHHQYHTNH